MDTAALRQHVMWHFSPYVASNQHRDTYGTVSHIKPAAAAQTAPRFYLLHSDIIIIHLRLNGTGAQRAAVEL